MILKDRMHKDSVDFERGYSWVSTTDLDDMKVAFDVSEIIYLDEAQEQRRQRELAEVQRQQESRDRERLGQEEAANAATAELASSEFEMIQSGTAIIQQAVQSVWSRPLSARNGMRAILQISMLPTGELIDTVNTESSGDPAFDRSAENAVFEASPFTELQAVPSRLFNENFRSFQTEFQPTDL